MPTTTNIPPGTAVTDLWPLSDEQLLDFRFNWVRDFAAVNCIRSITPTAGGSAYVDGDEIVVTPGGGDTTGTGAAGYIVVESGAIVSVVMTDLGRLYTVDPVITAPTGSGATFSVTRETVKLSGWNKATGSTYFSDADLQERIRAIVIDRRSELIAAYYDKLHEGVWDEQVPQSDADSATYAAYEQLQILYRWLRADCREIMINDPGFQGAVPEHARDKFFKQWNEGIVADKQFARQRLGGFTSVKRVQR